MPERDEDLRVDIASGGAPAEPSVILVVDDEADILASLGDVFEDGIEGARVVTARSAQQALALLGESPVHLIVTDYKMPGMNGLDFLREAQRVAPGVPRILITAFPDLDVAIRAINEAGVENFITKPFDPDQVVEVACTVLAQRRAEEARDATFTRSLDLLRGGARSKP